MSKLPSKPSAVQKPAAVVRTAGSARVPADENNVVEEGVDRSRGPSPNVMPEHLMIGGRKTPGRRPVARQVDPEPEDAPEDTVADDEIADEPAEEVDDVAAEESAEPGEATDEVDASELDDDALIDILLSDDGKAPAAQAAAAQKGDELDDDFKAEYDAVVEKWGEDIADTVIKPRLLREQKLRRQMEPVLSDYARRQSEETAQAEKAVVGFFEGQAKAGFSKVYGDSVKTAKPLQIQAIQRVMAKAIDIKQRLSAAGFNITPEKALERAHNQLWAKHPIGQKVAKTQATMEKRSESMTIPPTRGASAKISGNGQQKGDKYAQFKTAFAKAKIVR